MIRSALIGLVALSASAAAAGLPVPPVPPATPPETNGAPLPNPDIEAPAAPGATHTSVNMTFYQVKLPDPSLGFSPGSQYQNTEDRKPVHTPGFSLSVPIQ